MALSAQSNEDPDSMRDSTESDFGDITGADRLNFMCSKASAVSVMNTDFPTK